MQNYRLKLCVTSLILLLMSFGLSVMSCFAEEDMDTLSITTYYPSPYGVYKNLRVYPNDDSIPGDFCSNAGEMYYDNSEQTLYICSGTPSKWLPAPGMVAGIPKGAVMFFNLVSCPSGWSELTNARGRYAVGLPTGGTLGATVGTALTKQENRPVGSHAHSITDPGHRHQFSVFSTAPSGGGFGSTGNTSWEMQKDTLSAVTGITVNSEGAVDGTNAPYIQFLACEKN